MTINFANVNIGTTAGDGTGDPLRVAYSKINLNFANIAAGKLDAGNVSYTMGTPSNWNFSVYNIAQALDQVVLQSNTVQTAAYLTTYSGNISAGRLNVYGLSKYGTYTIGNLPDPVASGVGTRTFITDSVSDVTAAGAPVSAITPGGTHVLPVYSDGSIWRVG